MERGKNSRKTPVDIPSKEIYVIFNYKERKVYCINEFYKKFTYIDCLPANFRETELFIKHFYGKGIVSTSFRAYKEIDPLFHGTAKYKKVHETLELTAEQYIYCLRIISNPAYQCNSISDVFEYLRSMSNTQSRDDIMTENLSKSMFKAFQKIISELNYGLHNMDFPDE
jgi:hypothetical protein